MIKAIFLDRDGVINQAVIRNGRPYPPASLSEMSILPGVKEALIKLKQAEFKLIVVTNQPDVRTGIQQQSVVEAMHSYLSQTLPIDDIKVCYHIDLDQCSCRKPKPGMLQSAALDWSIDLTQSYMIGDRWRDIEAGAAVGCTTILIKNDYDERQPDHPDAICNSLLEASNLILSGSLTKYQKE